MSAATEIRAESTYFAQPYSIEATGFYFTTLEEYQAKAAKAVDRFGMPVEEFEIQYIDGDVSKLFTAVGVNQANLADWFDLLDKLDGDEDQYAIACHLANDGCSMDDLPLRWDDYSLYHGTAEDYARDMVEVCYDLPTNLEYYLDYGRLGRDMVLEGSLIELDHSRLLVR